MAGKRFAINLGAMLLGWLIYDQLCRSPFGQHNDWMLYLFIVALPIVAWGLGQFLSGRATYITVGGIIGSMMVGNVFFVIIPVQKKMVGAMLAGEPLMVRWESKVFNVPDIITT